MYLSKKDVKSTLFYYEHDLIEQLFVYYSIERRNA